MQKHLKIHKKRYAYDALSRVTKKVTEDTETGETTETTETVFIYDAAGISIEKIEQGCCT